MSRRSFPHIDPAALRDHADEARVDRVWERIDHSVATRVDRRQRPVTTLAYVAIAAALGAFAAGILVGKATWDRRLPVAQTPLATPAPEKSRVEVLAAGSQMRAFPLEGGGQISLDAGATAEVERAGTALTVSLLQGEATITSGQKGFSVVAGEARINTQSGSRVSVKRNAEDLDVRVDDGTVSVTSPDGIEQQLNKNDVKRTVPLHTTVASTRNEATPRRIPASPLRNAQKARVTTPKGVAQPEWLTLSQKDEEGALALLDKQGGVEQAINQARSAGELMAIGDMMRHKGRSPAAAMRAYRRVVESFKGDQYVSLAANYLADHYQSLGETALAQQYRETAKLHATMADALFCNLIEQEGNKAEASRLAMKYLAKYPNGQCHERAQELAPSADDAAPPAGDAPLPAAPPAPPAP